MKRLFALLLALCLLPVAAAAAQMQCDIKVEADRVSISGTLSVPFAAGVSMMLYRPGKSAADLATQPMDTVVAHLDETKANADGTFSFQFQLDGDAGDYPLVIDVKGLPDTLETVIPFLGKDYAGDQITLINGYKQAGDAANLRKTIEESYENLYLDATLYEAFAADGGDLDAYFALLARMEQVADVTALETQLDDAVVLLSLRQAADGKTAAALLAEYAPRMDLEDSTAYATYLDDTILTEEDREAVCGELAGGDYIDFAGVRSALEEATLVYACNKADSWGMMQKIVWPNRTLLGLETSDYEDVEDTEYVWMDMLGESYKTMDDIKQTFESAAQDRKDTEDQPSGGGGGGSGSGGGGGGRGSGSSSGFTQGGGAADISGQLDQNAGGATVAFADLDGFDWAQDSILRLHELGYINGKTQTTFAPADAITREEFVALLVRVFDLYDAAASCDFADVQSGDWYYGAVASGLQAGIVSGVGDGRFGVGEPITRQDMATLLYRTLTLENPALDQQSATLDFADAADIADYAKDAVALMQQSGIIQGVGDGRFAPQENANRAQAAVILDRSDRYHQGGDAQ